MERAANEHLKDLAISQWQDTEVLYRRQWQRLHKIVQYAYRNCPYYMRRFRSVDFDGDLKDWDDFRRLPLLSKREIRDNDDEMLSRQYVRGELVEARTGGSTGTALTIFAGTKCCQQMRNAAAMRSDQWAGWDIGMKVAAIWGNPPIANTLKKKLRNLLLDRFIYLDTININETSIKYFIEQWHRRGPAGAFRSFALDFHSCKLP